MTESNITTKVIGANKSLTYLLPLLGKFIELDFSSLILNCYIKFNRPMGIDYPFGILYDISGFSSYEEFSKYDDILRFSELFHSDFIINDDFRLYVFRFPSEFVPEYELFKQGKYSYFNKNAKDQILKYTITEYKYHPLTEDIVGILWKKKERRQKLEKLLGMSIPEELELSSIMDPEEETFKFKADE